MTTQTDYLPLETPDEKIATILKVWATLTGSDADLLVGMGYPGWAKFFEVNYELVDDLMRQAGMVPPGEAVESDSPDD